MSNLQVQVGADINELKSKLAEAQLLLEKLRKEKAVNVKAGLDVKDLQKQINDAKASVRTLSTELNKSAGAMNNHSKATANGGNTLMQFSRIAQDAPFGIMGIGNNLTATAEAFGSLSKSSGGAGAALKAVGASLLGPGGVLLAISLVTSALTYMSQKGITISDVFNKLTGNFDEYAAALKKVNDEAYSDESVVSAVANVESLRNEIQLAKDGFIDKEKVVKHYNETMGKAAGVVSTLDEVEKQLVKNGDAYVKMMLYKAAANLALEEAAKQSLKAEQTRIKKLEEFSNAALDADLTQTRSKEQYEAKQKNLERQRKKRQEEEVREIQKAANIQLDIAKNFQKKAAQIAKEGGLNIDVDTKAPKVPKVKKEAFKKDTDFDKNAEAALQGRYDIEAGIIKRGEEAKYKEMLKGQELQKKLAEERSRIALEGAAAEERARMKTIEGLREDLAAELILLKSYLNSKLITQEQYDLMAQEQRLKSLEAQRALVPEHQIISDAIVGTIQNMGSALAQALSTGANVVQSMGGALLAGLGGLLSAMGDHLIKIGTAAVLAGTVMKLFGTVTGVGAGLAAIAGGVLLKGVGGAIAAKGNRNVNNSAGASGGGDISRRGSISSGADVSSPTSSVSSGGTFNNSGGTVVFEIAGQKLIGVLNNTTQGNLRLGGSGLVG